MAQKINDRQKVMHENYAILPIICFYEYFINFMVMTKYLTREPKLKSYMKGAFHLIAQI